MLIWIVSLIITSPDAIFLTTSVLHEEDDYVYMDCTYSWPEENTKIYQLCIVTLLFLLPFVFMTISYSHIVNVLWRNETMTGSFQIAEEEQSIQRTRKNKLTSTTPLTTEKIVPGEHRKHYRNHHHNQDFNLRISLSTLDAEPCSVGSRSFVVLGSESATASPQVRSIKELDDEERKSLNDTNIDTMATKSNGVPRDKTYKRHTRDCIFGVVEGTIISGAHYNDSMAPIGSRRNYSYTLDSSRPSLSCCGAGRDDCSGMDGVGHGCCSQQHQGQRQDQKQFPPATVNGVSCGGHSIRTSNCCENGLRRRCCRHHSTRSLTLAVARKLSMPSDGAFCRKRTSMVVNHDHGRHGGSPYVVDQMRQNDISGACSSEGGSICEADGKADKVEAENRNPVLPYITGFDVLSSVHSRVIPRSHPVSPDMGDDFHDSGQLRVTMDSTTVATTAAAAIITTTTTTAIATVAAVVGDNNSIGSSASASSVVTQVLPANTEAKPTADKNDGGDDDRRICSTSGDKLDGKSSSRANESSNNGDTFKNAPTVAVRNGADKFNLVNQMSECGSALVVVGAAIVGDNKQRNDNKQPAGCVTKLHESARLLRDETTPICDSNIHVQNSTGNGSLTKHEALSMIEPGRAAMMRTVREGAQHNYEASIDPNSSADNDRPFDLSAARQSEGTVDDLKFNSSWRRAASKISVVESESFQDEGGVRRKKCNSIEATKGFSITKFSPSDTYSLDVQILVSGRRFDPDEPTSSGSIYPRASLDNLSCTMMETNSSTGLNCIKCCTNSMRIYRSKSPMLAREACRSAESNVPHKETDPTKRYRQEPPMEHRNSKRKQKASLNPLDIERASLDSSSRSQLSNVISGIQEMKIGPPTRLATKMMELPSKLSKTNCSDDCDNGHTSLRNQKECCKRGQGKSVLQLGDSSGQSNGHVCWSNGDEIEHGPDIEAADHGALGAVTYHGKSEVTSRNSHCSGESKKSNFAKRYVSLRRDKSRDLGRQTIDGSMTMTSVTGVSRNGSLLVTSSHYQGSSQRFASSSSQSNRYCKLIESRKKAAKMLIIVVIMFGLCYLPVHFLNILR